ncbi:Ubiquitin carboxyl-terminal hydrolase 14 [Dictyocoela muelleri]|nr:Ubiquitin carboxyl-terminal hydrolase 14 [Dictyocoela muelleri]
MLKECAYCYSKKILYLCECQIYLCNDHRSLHTKRDHETLYSIKDNKYESNKLTIDEIKEIQFNIFINDFKECPHQDLFKNNVTHKKESCECKPDWVCITCGYKGCSRESYQNKSKGHSIKHFKETGHPIVIKIDGHLVHCYHCDEFIKIKNYYSLRKYFGIDDVNDQENEFNKSLNNEINYNQERNNNIKDTENNHEKNNNEFHITENEKNLGKIVDKGISYVGIENIGNTCYNSSVLQFIGSIIVNENIDLDFHFNLCDDNPIVCFCCQFFKFLNCIKMNREQQKEQLIEIINIEPLIKIIEKEFGLQRTCQYDASEFFCLLLSKINEYENLYLIPKITDIFYIEIKRDRSCKSCNTQRKEIVEYTPFLIVPVRNSIVESVYSYFNGDKLDCNCGEYERISILRIPKYLIIVLRRVVTAKEAESYKSEEDNANNEFYNENNTLNESNNDENNIKMDNLNINEDHLNINEDNIKIKKKVNIKTIDLSEFYNPITPSEKSINNLVSLGFTSNEALKALLKSCNDENAAAEYLFNGGDLSQRENLIYDFYCSVIHVGNKCTSGHYVFHMSKKFFGENLTISDTKLFIGDIKEDSYIICFK